ncbi:hypothetical protein BDZ85DRAFT_268274 [Elsinoe ampelina]|uniref:Uncharacterized protein n=1 Tax=Elsinoe ampelina TaxID=302913 RepID=A0A6A6G2C2_9PEZI|nr:hypothetical protein BDZ85DRAFT_268274 [Elsinoe ampelina]
MMASAAILENLQQVAQQIRRLVDKSHNGTRPGTDIEQNLQAGIEKNLEYHEFVAHNIEQLAEGETEAQRAQDRLLNHVSSRITTMEDREEQNFELLSSRIENYSTKVLDQEDIQHLITSLYQSHIAPELQKMHQSYRSAITRQNAEIGGPGTGMADYETIKRQRDELQQTVRDFQNIDEEAATSQLTGLRFELNELKRQNDMLKLEVAQAKERADEAEAANQRHSAEWRNILDLQTRKVDRLVDTEKRQGHEIKLLTDKNTKYRQSTSDLHKELERIRSEREDQRRQKNHYKDILRRNGLLEEMDEPVDLDAPLVESVPTPTKRGATSPASSLKIKRQRSDTSLLLREESLATKITQQLAERFGMQQMGFQHQQQPSTLGYQFGQNTSPGFAQFGQNTSATSLGFNPGIPGNPFAPLPGVAQGQAGTSKPFGSVPVPGPTTGAFSKWRDHQEKSQQDTPVPEWGTMESERQFESPVPPSEAASVDDIIRPFVEGTPGGGTPQQNTSRKVLPPAPSEYPPRSLSPKKSAPNLGNTLPSRNPATTKPVRTNAPLPAATNPPSRSLRSRASMPSVQQPPASPPHPTRYHVTDVFINEESWINASVPSDTNKKHILDVKQAAWNGTPLDT